MLWGSCPIPVSSRGVAAPPEPRASVPLAVTGPEAAKRCWRWVELALGGHEVVSEDGALLALPPSTLGEGDGTGVNTSQGEDTEKVKSKHKKRKKNWERKGREGLRRTALGDALDLRCSAPETAAGRAGRSRARRPREARA